jgi:hypothetical protein
MECLNHSYGSVDNYIKNALAVIASIKTNKKDPPTDKRSIHRGDSLIPAFLLEVLVSTARCIISF